MSTVDPPQVTSTVDPGQLLLPRLHCRRLGTEPRPRCRRDTRPRATRVAEGAVLGGVCTGLARHLGWPVMVIRIGFVGLLLVQFLGAIAYGALWLLMPAEPPSQAPGSGGGHPSGMRTQRQADAAARLGNAGGAGRARASDCCGSCRPAGWGSASSCSGRWRSPARGRLWSGARPTPLSRSAGGPRPAARCGWPPSWPAAAGRRSSGSCVGLGLVGAAFGLVIAQQNQLQQLPEVMAMTVLALAGLAVVLAPWLYRSRAALNEARAERGAGRRPGRHGGAPARLGAADPRPDPAPGRRPEGRAALARRQERELRGWLYGDEAAEDDPQGGPGRRGRRGRGRARRPGRGGRGRRLRHRPRRAGAGPGRPRGDGERRQAFRGGPGRRVRRGRRRPVEVFVRDRGAGFDLDGVAEDRMGVKGSIIDRMRRHGGIGHDPFRPRRRAPKYDWRSSDDRANRYAPPPDRQPAATSPPPQPAGLRRPAGPGRTAWWWSTTTRCSGPASRPRSGRRCSVVGEARGRRHRDRGRPGRPSRTSCCWTCTCPAAAGSRCSSKVHETQPGAEVPGAVGLRCRRGRDRGDPGRRPRLRDQVDQRRRAGRRDPPGRRGRRGVLAPAGRLRAGRVLRRDRPRDRRRGSGPAVRRGSGRCCG